MSVARIEVWTPDIHPTVLCGHQEQSWSQNLRRGLHGLVVLVLRGTASLARPEPAGEDSTGGQQLRLGFVLESDVHWSEEASVRGGGWLKVWN